MIIACFESVFDTVCLQGDHVLLDYEIWQCSLICYKSDKVSNSYHQAPIESIGILYIATKRMKLLSV